MEVENSQVENSHSGFAMLDYKDALMRWSKSWAELADGAEHNLALNPSKLEDLESDAGYVSEGSYRKFYLGSKNGSVGSIEDCVYEEDEEDHYYSRASEDLDYGLPDDRDDVTEDVDDAAGDVDDTTEGEGLDVDIEMIGSECVLVNGRLLEDVPCPCEATRDGMTPEVNSIYDHEELIDLACRFLCHLKQDNIRPKIYWAMKYAPEYAEESDS